ncbi:hypothetical protein TNCV_2144181 [Trichonephila clavipes]|nr:hypothetical protein TNCV_2144181 [Trichonephila clavipes]
MYPWGTEVSKCFPCIAKVDLVKQRMLYLEPIAVEAWTARFRLEIDRDNKKSKEAIQSDRGVAVKSNTTPNHDTGCETSVSMPNATIQQSITTVSPNLNPTIVTLQDVVGFVSERNVVPFRYPCPPFTCGFQSRVNEAMNTLRTSTLLQTKLNATSGHRMMRNKLNLFYYDS